MTENSGPRAVLIASGGMDSTVTAYDLAARGIGVTLLSFDYGQRHRVELEYLEKTAARMGVPHERVDLTGVGRLLAGSALTDASVEVPDGRYSDVSMRATVVANRNMIMLSVAAGLAVARGAEIVAFGAHGGDHVIYPDCRPGFFERLNGALLTGNEGFLVDEFRLEAPFLNGTKVDIVRRGHQLGVPFELTWSCYRGGAVHCGTCGTCSERQEAFALAGIVDPTRYAAPAGAMVAR
ncbi:7-cyano-7-deazaguanine synthase QueC [Streptomyces qinzhouensis]|uniref:7-cyano-7-deazaguanine synthase n=1 Tax=Streptomyces qinzhouensis TaxID=2599401 RepID=A0A5B8IBA1_9ACTN|nr:7-cyano-7-deazaguanine synthase QueC [Streptomyces qinzhouensis]QDY75348.1 7-cyano-7-deazaguanine synthase QueC [Streptomyces qinzhouensis]